MRVLLSDKQLMEGVVVKSCSCFTIFFIIFTDLFEFLESTDTRGEYTNAPFVCFGSLCLGGHVADNHKTMYYLMCHVPGLLQQWRKSKLNLAVVGT